LQKTPFVFALGRARGVRVRHGQGLQDMRLWGYRKDSGIG